MEHIIKVNRRLVSSLHEYEIGRGAKFDLRELKHNPIMVKYLCQEHINDSYCIVGHVGELYRLRDRMLEQERIGNLTYREYLKETYEKESN